MHGHGCDTSRRMKHCVWLLHYMKHYFSLVASVTISSYGLKMDHHLRQLISSTPQSTSCAAAVVAVRVQGLLGLHVFRPRPSTNPLLRSRFSLGSTLVSPGVILSLKPRERKLNSCHFSRYVYLFWIESSAIMRMILPAE